VGLGQHFALLLRQIFLT